jgi:endo-1,4-beta-xylanase
LTGSGGEGHRWKCLNNRLQSGLFFLTFQSCKESGTYSNAKSLTMKTFKIQQIAALWPAIIIATLLFTNAFAPPTEEPATLKDAFRGKFLVGTALNGSQIFGMDTLSASLIETQFNSITPENCMKWGPIHPKPGTYNFEMADRFVEFGEEHQMHMAGHVLVWHSQTPRWVFQDAEGNLTTRDTLLMRMRDHIYTVVGRYKGRIDSWDVVNEAIGDDGKIRESLWYKIIGEDFIEKAFTYAREADPDAQLIYNDYSLPNPAKREGVVNMVKALQAKGVPIDGIGMQGHYNLGGPSLEDVEASIVAFGELGMKVMITEMEINVLPAPSAYSGADVGKRFNMDPGLNPYTEGLPDSVQTALADRYRELFTIFSNHSDQIDRVTFWGVHDGVSWKNNWPIPGRTNHPLLFDRECHPKPAFYAVMEVAKQN